MKFFINEKQRKQTGGSCYFEFQKGQHNAHYKDVFWKEDSLLLHMDLMDSLELFRIIPDFDYYGVTIIDKEKWEVIKSNAQSESGILNELITELKSWVDENFNEFSYFVICGI